MKDDSIVQTIASGIRSKRAIRASRRALAVRALATSAIAATVAALALAGSAAPASAAESPDSSITVRWADGAASVGADASVTAAQVTAAQVNHTALLSDGNGNDGGSGHWDDFKDLELTVEKTNDLGDEAITVTATGMATTLNPEAGLGILASGSNYLQVMQCWGPDPLATDFDETCQFGSWDGTTGDNESGKAIGAIVGIGAATRPGTQTGTPGTPFRTVSNEVDAPIENSENRNLNGLSEFFTASSSNEIPWTPFDAGETARFSFEAQSAASQPYLGCGTDSAQRCWLVVVPRGTHSGELEAPSDVPCALSVYGSKAFGGQTLAQVGPPLGRSCTYWQDRIVVPLDFRELGSGCAIGSSETRVVGTELLSGAMSSWQRGLCASSGSAYGLATNSGAVSRGQLLTGQADAAASLLPITPDTIGATDPTTLDNAEIAYAPIANTGLTISYLASTAYGTEYENLKLTPRLIAKALTQSYRFDVPQADSALPDFASYWPNQPFTLSEDPEFQELNQLRTSQDNLPTARGSFVVSGPQSEDAVSLLWRYVQADADAVAFLRGEPDPWGNTINPYYLPSGNPAALGGGLPFDLSKEPIDQFLKADSTLAPQEPEKYSKVGYNLQQFDSLTAIPYSTTLESNAARIFHRDTKYVTTWDPEKLNSANESGAFVPDAPQIGNKGIFIAGPTDAASAANYDLPTMQLPLPLATRTTKDTNASARHFVSATAATISKAIDQSTVDRTTGIATLDVAQLSGDSYPLSATNYLAFDRAQLDPAAGERYATLLDYAAGPGNVPGPSTGQLPAGYAPLNADQIARSAATASILRSLDSQEAPDEPGSPNNAGGNAPPNGPTPNSLQPQTLQPEAGAGAQQGAPTEDTSASPQTQVTASEAAETQQTPGGPAGAAIGGALATGVAGLLASPFLLRRRGISA